jgi:DNA polymerase III subunit epsilon
MKNPKYVYIDVETTGLSPKKSGIIQLAGLIEVDGEIVSSFDYKMQPKPDAIIDPKAMEVNGILEEDIPSLMLMEEAYRKFIRELDFYVDRFDKADKVFFVGYNCQSFDCPFVRQWFSDNGNKFYGAYFWVNSIDIMCLASEFLKYVRPEMPNFKQSTVANFLGIDVDESNIHDAIYDINLTRDIYKKLTEEE